jgi:P27 family predicted phage terminase small subunit
MAGRRPKPTAIKKLQGNPGKRPLNKKEPKPPAAAVSVPRGRLPDDGKRLWRALAPMLANLKVLTEADLPALEMLCLHYAVARAALKEMLQDGRVEIEDDQGHRYTISEGIAVTAMGITGVKKHPAASVFRENSTAFRMYLTEFGLTPASRVRLKMDGGEEEKSLAEMLFEAVHG